MSTIFRVKTTIAYNIIIQVNINYNQFYNKTKTYVLYILGSNYIKSMYSIGGLLNTFLVGGGVDDC